MHYRFDCKYFNGYKPCHPYKTCKDCPDYLPQGFRIFIINLDALGDVLMTTALLPAIKEAYPISMIYWLTLPLATPLLENNPYIDEIIPWSPETLSWLPHMDFDLVLSCDRDRKSTAVAMSVSAVEKRGFGLGPQGVVIPLNAEMAYAYQMGLDDTLKFRSNRQTGQQILAEGLGFPYKRREYILELTDDEKKHIAEFRAAHGLGGTIRALGINTGCSGKFKYKRLNENQLVRVIEKILEKDHSGRLRILLLGGASETALNDRLIDTVRDARLIATPTQEGIRRGLHYIAASDVCLTGDTFGLHAAIALKVPSVAFFTISCDVEIDFYDRGYLVVADVPCRPCWKPWCPDPVCIDRIDLDDLADGVWHLLHSHYGFPGSA